MPLCTARFAAERHAVVRGSNPRGRIFLDRLGLGARPREVSLGAVTTMRATAHAEPGAATRGSPRVVWAPEHGGAERAGLVGFSTIGGRHRRGRDAWAPAESRSCLRGRSGPCYPVPRGTKCMHHRSAPLRWRGVSVPLVAARRRRDDHMRVGCTPVPELRNDRVCMDREGRTAQRLALVEGLGRRQGPAERVLLLDLVYTHEPIFTGKHFVERSELGRR